MGFKNSLLSVNTWNLQICTWFAPFWVSPFTVFRWICFKKCSRCVQVRINNSMKIVRFGRMVVTFVLFRWFHRNKMFKTVSYFIPNPSNNVDYHTNILFRWKPQKMQERKKKHGKKQKKKINLKMALIGGKTCLINWNSYLAMHTHQNFTFILQYELYGNYLLSKNY